MQEKLPKISIKRIKRYSVFWKFAVAVFLADQITKLLVLWQIPWEPGKPTYALPGEWYYDKNFAPVEVIPNFFYLVHIDNPGAAWSLFAGQQVFLSLFALVALAGIFFFRKSLELDRLSSQVAIGLLAGGICGNLLDRLVHHHVIDFLDVHLPLYGRWPAFNIADCGIVIGVILYIAMSALPLFGRNHPKAKRFSEEDSLQ